MNLKNKKIINFDKMKPYMIFLFTFILIYLILVMALVNKKYVLKSGDIASMDIKAPREFEDEVATQKKIKEAVEAVKEQYSESDAKKEAMKNIESLFSKTVEFQEGILVELSNVTTGLDNTKENKEKLIKQQALKLKEEFPIRNLSDDNYETLMELKPKDLTVLKNFLVKTLTKLFDETRITENKTEQIAVAQSIVLATFNDAGFSKSTRELGIYIAYSQIKPNLIYNIEKTEEAREEARKSVKPIIIKKDQTIVKEGEPVTDTQINLLKNLGLFDDKSSIDWYVYISLGVLVIMILFVQWFYLYKFYNDIFQDNNKLWLINLLTVISLILAKSLSIISLFIIPLACVPMLLTILFEDKLALTISILNCILISVSVKFNIEVTILATLNAVLGVIILKRIQQRNDILYSSVYIGIINIPLVLSMGFLLSNSIGVFAKAGFVFISSVISGVLTIGILPLLESVFDIVTTIKLLELSNPNQPLLKRLLLEAPGTYHHSVLVGNLSEMAAESIGANQVLARVSSYYHDIGKLKRPYFFKENQLGNDNPHDKINANLSTLIIISHIKDGIDMAKEYKVPKVIQDVIEQHHGTSLVKYFYITMKNSSENPEDVKEEDFMYKGPTPLSKEAAIVMLADGVEAAVRSISNPTKGKIEEMVNNIIKARLNEGQLDDCDLTLKDLEKIRKAFLKVLSGIYHERIEYPLDKWQNEDKRSS